MKTNIKEQIFSFPHEQGAIVYFKKIDTAIYCTSKLEGIIHEVGNEIIPQIIDEDFTTLKNEKLVPDQYTLTILPSNKCNLKCRYCYSEAAEQKDEKVTINAVNSSIDYMFKRAVTNNIHKVLFDYHGGGEPLHKENHELILRTLEYAENKAKKLGIKLFTAITTNATHNDKASLEIVKKMDYCNISLDGPEYIHNFHRPKANGGGSFDDVKLFIKAVQKMNKNINAMTVVSGYSVDKLDEIIDCYDKLGIKYGLIEPLHEVGRCTVNQSIKTPN